MRNLALYLVTFAITFCGIMLGAEYAMQPYEEGYGVMSENYGASSTACGEMGEGFDLYGWQPISSLRGPAKPICIPQPTVGPAAPICDSGCCPGGACVPNLYYPNRIINQIEYPNRIVYPNSTCHNAGVCNGSCGSCSNGYYHQGPCGNTWRHWEYRRWQPLKNAVRFFHNNRPFRRAVGFGFCRGCR